MIRLIFFTSLLLSINALALSKEDIKEIARASEAAPKHITDTATILKFEKGKFVEIRKGSNNFKCLVVHEPKGRYEPSCFNLQASRSILPAYELHMKLMYEGHSYGETYSALDKAFKEGKLPKAETAALVYMMSPNNKFYWNGKLGSSPVHHMYYFPKLDDKVFSLEEGPVSLWQGFPHLSALIVVIPSPNENKRKGAGHTHH